MGSLGGGSLPPFLALQLCVTLTLPYYPLLLYPVFHCYGRRGLTACSLRSPVPSPLAGYLQALVE